MVFCIFLLFSFFSRINSSIRMSDKNQHSKDDLVYDLECILSDANFSCRNNLMCNMHIGLNFYASHVSRVFR